MNFITYSQLAKTAKLFFKNNKFFIKCLRKIRVVFDETVQMHFCHTHRILMIHLRAVKGTKIEKFDNSSRLRNCLQLWPPNWRKLKQTEFNSEVIGRCKDWEKSLIYGFQGFSEFFKNNRKLRPRKLFLSRFSKGQYPRPKNSVKISINYSPNLIEKKSFDKDPYQYF